MRKFLEVYSTLILTQDSKKDDHEVSGVLKDKETQDFSQSFVSGYHPRSTNDPLTKISQDCTQSMYGSLDSTAFKVKIKRGAEVLHTRQMSNTSSSIGDSNFSIPQSIQNNIYLNTSHPNTYLKDESPFYQNETDSAHSRQQSSSSSAVSAPPNNYDDHKNSTQILDQNYQSFELPLQANAAEPAERNSPEGGDDLADQQQEIDYGYSSTSTSSTETSSAPSSGIVFSFLK